MVATSASLALLVGELAIRQLVPVDRGTSQQFRIPDRSLGWVLEPGRRYHNPLPEGAVLIQHNSRGWRDVEHAQHKPPGTYRTVILGDSFMEAYSVELDDAFSRRLEWMLRERGVAAEVINLGVGGYGTLQEYLAFARVGRDYAPDLVMLAFTVSNDVTNNSLTLERLAARNPDHVDSRPFLMPDGGSFEIRALDFEAAERRYEEGLRWRESLRYRIRERSALLQLLDRVLEGRSRRDPRAGAMPQAKHGSAWDLGFLGVHFCEEPPEVGEAWDLTRRILARLKRDVEAEGARLVVFSVPSIHETVPEFMVDTAQAAAEPGRICLEAAPGFARLAGILEEFGIAYLDLLPRFREAVRTEPRPFFLRSDLHWNAAGHALAAELAVAWLAGLEPSLRPANVQLRDEGPRPGKHWGE